MKYRTSRFDKGISLHVLSLQAVLFAMAAVAAILADHSTSAAQEQPPNVLLLVSDDQRPDTISALGNPYLDTPHLDRLAREGVVMTRAVCSNPICTPSRAEILTGCTGFRNGVSYFGRTIDPKLTTWPQAMRRAGFHTWYVGKWHNNGRPQLHGYEESEGLFSGGGGRFWKDQTDWKGRPITGYRGWLFQSDQGKLFPEKGVGLTSNISSHFADAAIRLLNRKPDKPFFLHVNFTAPHDPLIMPPGFEKKYSPQEIPLPPSFKKEHPFDHGNIKGRDEVLLPWPRTPQDVRDELAMYYAVISHMDQQIGRIFDTLEENGQWDNSLIIFTSDHGLAMGSHGLRGKQNMYEHTIGVPMLIKGPMVRAGKRLDAQVYLRDLYPTVCELTGAAAPGDLDGRSFAPVLQGKQTKVRNEAFGYFRDSQRMIRTDRWKLIYYPQVKRYQLFDLERDPYELRNLSDKQENRRTLEELQRRLASWQRKVGDPLVEK